MFGSFFHLIFKQCVLKAGTTRLNFSQLGAKNYFAINIHFHFALLCIFNNCVPIFVPIVSCFSKQCHNLKTLVNVSQNLLNITINTYMPSDADSVVSVQLLDNFYTVEIEGY